MTNNNVRETHVAERPDEYITRVLAQAPSLTNERRTRLAELLWPIRKNPPYPASLRVGGPPEDVIRGGSGSGSVLRIAERYSMGRNRSSSGDDIA